MTIFRIILGVLIVLILMGAEPEPEIDWGHCETDAECAALWGDDGGPEPYPLED